MFPAKLPCFLLFKLWQAALLDDLWAGLEDA